MVNSIKKLFNKMLKQTVDKKQRCEIDDLAIEARCNDEIKLMDGNTENNNNEDYQHNYGKLMCKTRPRLINEDKNDEYSSCGWNEDDSFGINPVKLRGEIYRLRSIIHDLKKYNKKLEEERDDLKKRLKILYKIIKYAN